MAVVRRIFTAAIIAAALAAAGCASYWLLYPGMAESNDPHINPSNDGNSYQAITVTNAQGNRLTG